MKKASLSLKDLEKALEDLANYCEENQLVSEPISIVLERQDQDTDGEITEYDFDLNIGSADVGKHKILSEKIMDDLLQDTENLEEGDLRIPTEIEAEIVGTEPVLAEQETKAVPTDSFSFTAPEPEIENVPTVEASDEDLSNINNEMDFDNVSQTPILEEEPEVEDNIETQESEIVTAEAASASADPETVSSTANYDNEEVERESLTNKNDSMEQTQQSPSPNNSIATFEQYLQDIEIEEPTTEVISQSAILKSYGLPENRQEIDPHDVVTVAKYDFLVEKIHKQQDYLNQINVQYQTKLSNIRSEIKNNLTKFYWNKADPSVITDRINEELTKLVDTYNAEVLTPYFKKTNAQFVDSLKTFQDQVDEDFEVKKKAAIAKLEAEAQSRKQAYQNEYNAQNQKLMQEVEDKVLLYRAQQVPTVKQSVYYQTEKVLTEKKNELLIDSQKKQAEIAKDYLNKVNKFIKKIHNLYENSEELFKANALEKRKLDLEDQKRQDDKEITLKKLETLTKQQTPASDSKKDSQEQEPKQPSQSQQPFNLVIPNQSSSPDDNIAKIYQDIIDRYENYIDKKLAELTPPQPPTVDKEVAADNVVTEKAAAEQVEEKDNTNSVKKRKLPIKILTGLLILTAIIGAGDLGYQKYESMQQEHQMQIQQLENKINHLNQKKSSQNKNTASAANTAQPQQESLESLLVKRDYQTAEAKYPDGKSLDQIAQQMYTNQDVAALQGFNQRHDNALGRYNHALLTNNQSELLQAALQLNEQQKTLMTPAQKQFLINEGQK
ncbi:hypothetical protein [Bombilactobacillus bombi]|uniref:hypothetical protein n=1 Tax=Bombilactobacillus bombi TaxID=1303590 RepID=UPI0035F088C4